MQCTLVKANDMMVSVHRLCWRLAWSQQRIARLSRRRKYDHRKVLTTFRRRRTVPVSTHALSSSRDHLTAASVHPQRPPAASEAPAMEQEPTSRQERTRWSRAVESAPSKRPASRKRRKCRTWTNVSPATSRRFSPLMTHPISCWLFGLLWAAIRSAKKVSHHSPECQHFLHSVC